MAEQRSRSARIAANSHGVAVTTPMVGRGSLPAVSGDRGSGTGVTTDAEPAVQTP